MQTNKMQLTLTLPGQVVNVEENKVTLELPAIEAAIVRGDAIDLLTAGLSRLESDVLIERISHFAVTESLRARIALSGITTIGCGAPKGWDKV